MPKKQTKEDWIFRLPSNSGPSPDHLIIRLFESHPKSKNQGECLESPYFAWELSCQYVPSKDENIRALHDATLQYITVLLWTADGNGLWSTTCVAFQRQRENMARKQYPGTLDSDVNTWVIRIRSPAEQNLSRTHRGVNRHVTIMVQSLQS